MKRLAFLPILAVAFAAACQDPPTAVQTPGAPRLTAATTFTVSQVSPFTGSVFVPCAGEDVQLTGSVHHVYHYTINGNNISIKGQDNSQGITGTGMISGDKYQSNFLTPFEQSGSLNNGQFEFTLMNESQMIGQGTLGNFLLHTTQHFTINANGDLTADVMDKSAECR